MFLSPQERQSVIISNEDSISKVPHELVAKRLKTHSGSEETRKYQENLKMS